MHTQKKTMKNIGLKKRIASTVLALTLVLGMIMSTVPVGLTDGTATIVEAASKKKDKKKPVIKMSGKSKMTVTKGVSVKIPKVTAKDNKDGNVTKKIKITVKKGKKSYSSIAKKIKNNKKVKFTATGKYTITYTVKDKVGNKATKKRYVTVKKKEKTTTENATTEDPKPEAQTYKTEKITIDDNTYNVSSDINFYNMASDAELKKSNDINIIVENDYSHLFFDLNSGLTQNFNYLKFLGSIKATDANGNDISDSLIIGINPNLAYKNDTQFRVYAYAKDKNGNVNTKVFYMHFLPEEAVEEYCEADGYVLVNEKPLVCGVLRNVIK